MLRQQARLISALSIALDQFSLVVAFTCAYVTRKGWTGFETYNDRLWLLLLILPCWYLLYQQAGIYNSLRTVSFWGLVGKLARAHLWGGLFVASLLYLTKTTEFSRAVLLLFLLYSMAFSLLIKQMVSWILAFFRRKGHNVRYLLVVGTGSVAESFLQLVDEHENWGLRVVGLIEVPGENDRTAVKQGHTVIGTLEQVAAICMQQPVDEVIFCVPRQVMVDIDEFLLSLGELGITVRMVLSAGGAFTAQREISLFHGALPILTFHAYAFDAAQLLLKRCLDIVGALVGLGITALLLPFVALAIKLESPGPVLFGQERFGRHGRVFLCWKFRSMFIDAEERKQELMAQNEMNGAMFKIKDDPRITRVGKFIRKTSIDEFPQFWNVLCGEMSLVGPRPLPVSDFKDNHRNWHRKRICVTPGVTGPWQISGRNQIADFDEVVRLDIQYIDNWSVWGDIRIIFKTIWVVLAGSGAR